jgi:hypothetical protein
MTIKVLTVKRSSNDPDDLIKDIKADPVAGPAFTAFEASAKIYYQQVHDEAVEGLDEEGVRLFELWWGGGSIGKDIGWERFGKEHPKAYSACLSACSQGCG